MTSAQLVGKSGLDLTGLFCGGQLVDRVLSTAKEAGITLRREVPFAPARLVTFRFQKRHTLPLNIDFRFSNRFSLSLVHCSYLQITIKQINKLCFFHHENWPLDKKISYPAGWRWIIHRGMSAFVVHKNMHRQNYNHDLFYHPLTRVSNLIKFLQKYIARLFYQRNHKFHFLGAKRWRQNVANPPPSLVTRGEHICIHWWRR